MSTHLVLDADVAAEGGGGDALQLQPLCRLLRCRLINVRYHHLRALVAKARRACVADALRAACARHVAELSTRPCGWTGHMIARAHCGAGHALHGGAPVTMATLLVRRCAMPDTIVTFRSCLSISAISDRCCLFFMW